jgi:hypothetical protein
VNACLRGVGLQPPRALLGPYWGFDDPKFGLGLVFPTPRRGAFTVNAPLCGVGFLEPPADTIFVYFWRWSASRPAHLGVFNLNSPGGGSHPTCTGESAGDTERTNDEDDYKDYKRSSHSQTNNDNNDDTSVDGLSAQTPH